MLSLKLGLVPTGGTTSSSWTLGPGDRGGGGYIFGRSRGDDANGPDDGKGECIWGCGDRGGFGERGTISPSVESLRLGDLNFDSALSKDRKPNMERTRDTRDGVFCSEVAVGDDGSAVD